MGKDRGLMDETTAMRWKNHVQLWVGTGGLINAAARDAGRAAP